MNTIHKVKLVLQDLHQVALALILRQMLDKTSGHSTLDYKCTFIKYIVLSYTQYVLKEWDLIQDSLRDLLNQGKLISNLLHGVGSS